MQNINEIKCELCNSPAELKHSNFTGYQEGTTFEIYFCQHCQTSFSLPKVSAYEIYDAIYKNGADVPAYDRYWNYFETIKKYSKPLQYLAKTEASYWGIAEALKQVVKNKQGTRVLEIGSGLGYLTYSLRKEGYNAYGMDISQEAVNNANNNFGNYYLCQDLFDYAETNAKSFDVVILTEVIEHVENPISFIGSILKLLKPNGKAILTTPNKSFHPVDTIWDTDLPPVHCWWFSEDSIKFISDKLNLSTHFINFSKFYKKNYKLHKSNNNLPSPIFDKNWNLISKSNPQRKISTIYKSIIFSIPFVKTIYIKSKCYFNPNIIKCSERGLVLCAILHKTDGEVDSL